MIFVIPQLLKHREIADNVARGWLSKALEELQKSGIDAITDKAWGGLNN